MAVSRCGTRERTTWQKATRLGTTKRCGAVVQSAVSLTKTPFDRFTPPSLKSKNWRQFSGFTTRAWWSGCSAPG